MIISDFLYKALPENTEGELTKIKSVVVSQSTLARVSAEAHLKDFSFRWKGFARKQLFPKIAACQRV